MHAYNTCTHTYSYMYTLKGTHHSSMQQLHELHDFILAVQLSKLKHSDMLCSWSVSSTWLDVCWMKTLQKVVRFFFHHRLFWDESHSIMPFTWCSKENKVGIQLGFAEWMSQDETRWRTHCTKSSAGQQRLLSWWEGSATELHPGQSSLVTCVWLPSASDMASVSQEPGSTSLSF